MDKEFIIYIAGFFDGEGCVGIYPNGKGNYHIRVQTTQNVTKQSKPLFQKLLALFGGGLTQQKTLSNNIKYNWQLSGDNALQFLKAISPFLVLKKEQVILAIEWQSKRPKQSRNKMGQVIPFSNQQKIEDKKVCKLIASMKK